MIRCVETVMNSLVRPWNQLNGNNWLAEITMFYGYEIRLQATVQGQRVLLQVQTMLVLEREWDPNAIAAVLLEANVGLMYGSFRFVEGPAGRLVALGHVCDTRYLPPPLLCEIARRLVEQYFAMIRKLYAMDMIGHGPLDGGWGSPC